MLAILQAIKSKNMEFRKSPKVNLENKRLFFFEIGFILALMFVFAAFEYRSYEKNTINLPPDRSSNEFEDMAPIVNKKPEPPKPPPQQHIIINLVDDIDEVDELPDINAEINQEDEIPFYVPQKIEDENIPDDIPYVPIPEEPAQFPGGLKALYQYLKDNLKYPDRAKKLVITGTVYVEFMVEKDGSVSNIKIIRPVGGGCNEEAIRVIENMPQWIPAKQRKQPVRTKWTLPIKFSLSQM